MKPNEIYYVDTYESGGPRGPFDRESDRRAEPLARQRGVSLGAVLSEVRNALAKEQPELYAINERMLYAVRNRDLRVVADQRERRAVEQFRDRDEKAQAEYFQAGAEAGSDAKAESLQIINAARAQSYNEDGLTLLRESVQYATDLQRDPLHALPPTAVVLAGLDQGPYEQTPEGVRLRPGWEIDGSRNVARVKGG